MAFGGSDMKTLYVNAGKTLLKMTQRDRRGVCLVSE